MRGDRERKKKNRKNTQKTQREKRLSGIRSFGQSFDDPVLLAPMIFEAEVGDKGENGEDSATIGMCSEEMVDHRSRVVLADETVGALLDRERSSPRLMDELIGDVSEYRDVVADIFPVRIQCESRRDRIIGMCDGFEEGGE